VRVLCRLGELPDGGARGFLPDRRGIDRVFAVRRGAAVRVYLNDCPHERTPLDWAKDQFLAHPGGDIVCSGHGARFDPESGRCIAGACLGQALIAVGCRVEGGQVLIAEPPVGAPGDDGAPSGR